MTKILDANFVGSQNSKYIELRKGVLINGQYYLKDTMQPVPFCQVFINDVNCSSYSNLVLDKFINHSNSAYISNNSSVRPNNCIYFDEVNENITYVCYKNVNYISLLKFDESNSLCRLVKKIFVVSNSTNDSPLKISQKNGEIEVATMSVSNSCINLYTYDKDLNLLQNKIISTSGSGYCYASVLSDDLYNSCQSSRHILTYFDRRLGGPQSHTFNYVGTTAGVIHMSINDVFSETEKEIKILYPSPKTESSASYISDFFVFQYDKSEGKWLTPKKIEVTNTAENINYLVANSTCTNDVFLKTIDGKHYIFIYHRPNILQSSSKIICFEYIPKNSSGNEEFKFIKIQNMPIGQCGQIIYEKQENKTIFYGYSKVGANAGDLLSSVYCYELNHSTLEFEKTFAVSGVIRDFGLDKNKDLYILWNDYSIDKYNERTVSSFNAKFEKGLYEYKGENIDTNLIVSTSNLQGELLSKDVILDIKGNAIFKDTGNKTITFKTSSIEENKIPVTITGAGSLNIFPKVKA